MLPTVLSAFTMRLAFMFYDVLIEDLDVSGYSCVWQTSM